MDIEQPVPIVPKPERLSSTNDRSVEDLWKSLLIPSITTDGLFESQNQCSNLQGISILFQTTFFHVKDICLQLQQSEKELVEVRQEWQSSVQCCQGLKEALKSAKTSCMNCEKLKADLSAATALNRNISSVIMSVLNTFNLSSRNQPDSEAQVKKAYDMVTQALQGTQDILPVNDKPKQESSQGSHPEIGGKQKRSLDIFSSPNDVLYSPEKQPVSKKLFKSDLRIPSDSPRRLVIPETLDTEENFEPPSPVKISNGVDGERRVLCDVSVNVPTTPKKGISKPNSGSPILGNSYKKPGRSNTPARGDDSPGDLFEDFIQVQSPARRNVLKSQEIPSPSLLNPEKCQDSKIEAKGRLAPKSVASGGSPQTANKVVKLDKAGDITFERRPGGLRKMKQQKLSLASFARVKQDISSLKEFNGGVRAQTSDLGVETLGEDQQLQLAMQESLLEAERIKKEEEGLLKLLKHDDATFWDPAANDDEDIIAATPERTIKPIKKGTEYQDNSKSDTMTLPFDPVITSTMLKAGCSMDTFAPDFHSTEKNPRNETFTPNPNLDALLEEMGEADTAAPPPRFETSFDRPPPKKDTSPNYKYKRGPVRKKSERKKLCGHAEGPCCSNFINQNGIDANKVSRHRDRYGPQTSTPRGYWDPSFPHSLQENQ